MVFAFKLLKAVGDIFLEGAIVASTCEPCPMCMAALHWARVDTVYYGTSGSVFRSLNGGRRWRAINNGLESQVIRDLAVDPNSTTEPFPFSTVEVAGESGEGICSSNAQASRGESSWSRVSSIESRRSTAMLN